MAQAKKGDTVRVNYIGKLDDGTEFYNSTGKEPLKFTIGSEEVIVGFEEAVIGMNAGDTKTVRITADKAYGPHRKELQSVIPREQFPGHITPEVYQILRVTSNDGQHIFIRVIEVTDKDVTVDGNHPLAGKDLTYEIHLIEILTTDTQKTS
ncbi:MAG: peptidylprolyl isomerase [Planctomycetota bacterium]